MPSLTTLTPGGYDNDDLMQLLHQMHGSSFSLGSKLGKRIGSELTGPFAGQKLNILTTFSGGAHNELPLLQTAARLRRLLITDGAPACTQFVQAEVAGHEAVRCHTVAFPVPADDKNNDLDALRADGPFHAITCLGVSFFHLETSDQRLTTLRQWYDLLAPGGLLFLDNKNWTPDLREERDPATAYDIPDGSQLLCTYEYPRQGIQHYHLQHMAPKKESDTGKEPKSPRETQQRWMVTGYPVRTGILLEEMLAAGLEIQGLHNKAFWASGDQKDNTHPAYYHMLIARKPGGSDVAAAATAETSL